MKRMSKSIAVLLVLVMFGSMIMSCGTTSGPSVVYTTPVVYSFAEEGVPSAIIDFVAHWDGKNSYEDVNFIDFNGIEMPPPAPGTYWMPSIRFPAGVPFKLNVYVERDRTTTDFQEVGNIAFPDLSLSGVSGEGAIGLIFLFPLMAAFYVVCVVGFVVIVLPIDAIVSKTGDRYKYVTFECPALQAGEQYELSFNYRAAVNDELTLSRVYTEQRRGLFRTREIEKREIVAKQRFQATLAERDETRDLSHFFPSVINTSEMPSVTDVSALGSSEGRP